MIRPDRPEDLHDETLAEIEQGRDLAARYRRGFIIVDDPKLYNGPEDFDRVPYGTNPPGAHIATNIEMSALLMYHDYADSWTDAYATFADAFLAWVDAGCPLTSESEERSHDERIPI